MYSRSIIFLIDLSFRRTIGLFSVPQFGIVLHCATHGVNAVICIAYNLRLQKKNLRARQA